MIRVLAILAVLACVPSAAAAQISKLEPVLRTVHKELNRYEDQLDLRDMTHEIWTGQLRNEEKVSLTVPLEPGEDYVIMGVCDEYCDDIDLRLFSGTTLVDEDVEADDYPVVQVKPNAARSYRLEVLMESCDTSPCRYGVAIYAK
ncbi:MAG: hypothetical protein KY464_05245 [Gemmatimonadetes bacterium]|nr:hypothetical protein [Gemmatimonadota bacterium]